MILESDTLNFLVLNWRLGKLCPPRVAPRGRLGRTPSPGAAATLQRRSSSSPPPERPPDFRAASVKVAAGPASLSSLPPSPPSNLLIRGGGGRFRPAALGSAVGIDGSTAWTARSAAWWRGLVRGGLYRPASLQRVGALLPRWSLVTGITQLFTAPLRVSSRWCLLQCR
jgi:hypothetical protein